MVQGSLIISRQLGTIQITYPRQHARNLDTGIAKTYNNVGNAGVAELADAADLKFYANLSTSGFTYKIELLCQSLKPRFEATVPFGVI